MERKTTKDCMNFMFMRIEKLGRIKGGSGTAGTDR